MPFILHTRSCLNQSLALPAPRRFDALGGTIGRTQDNDLILHDPNKSISRKHAQIIFHNGTYYLADIGSNPSMVNNVVLGLGKEVALKHGDSIVIGDYVLEAEFEPERGTILPSQEFELKQSQLVEQGLPVEASNTVALARIVGGTIQDAYTHPLGGDPLGVEWYAASTNAAQQHRGSQSDHLSPENQALSLPVAETANTFTIPDDFDPLADLNTSAKLHSPVASAPVQSVAVSASVPVDETVSDNTVLSALLRGLDLQEQDTQKTPAELAETVGYMLHETIAGTMSVLAARAAMKRESRVDMTMISSQTNNPLKFMPDTHSALKQMLSNELPGYMSAEKAIGVAFDDLRNHELAMMAGMQAVLTGILRHFNPVEIEKQVKQSNLLDTVLNSNRKMKLWNRYVEVYEEIMRGIDDDFQRFFSDQFSAAYEAQVERLRNS